MHLDTRQSGRLSDLKHAWKAQSEAMSEMLDRQAKERDELYERMYADVVKATALALEAKVPKRQIGLAVGTANYAANRKGLHAEATELLATMQVVEDVKVQNPDVTRDEVLAAKDKHAETWAQALTLTHVGTTEHGELYTVQDPLEIVQEMYLDGSGPVSYDDTPGLARLIVLAEDALTKKMEAVNNE